MIFVRFTFSWNQWFRQSKGPVSIHILISVNVQKSWTALMYAVSANHPRVVKELLLAGADPSDKDKVCTDLNTCTHILWLVLHVNVSKLSECQS